MESFIFCVPNGYTEVTIVTYIIAQTQKCLHKQFVGKKKIMSLILHRDFFNVSKPQNIVNSIFLPSVR